MIETDYIFFTIEVLLIASFFKYILNRRNK